jgi:hypothetical protein
MNKVLQSHFKYPEVFYELPVAVSYWELNWTQSQNQSHISTDGESVSQSVSLGVEPHLGLMTRYLLLFDTFGLDFVGRPLWREDRSVFVYAPGPCQRSLSRVRVPWDSWPYFNASGLRLPFSSPPTTRRVMVEVFDPAFTLGQLNWFSLYSLRTDHAQNTQFCCCIRKITQRISHVIPSQRLHWFAVA